MVNPLKPPGLLGDPDSDVDLRTSAVFWTGVVGDKNSGGLVLPLGVEWLGRPFLTTADFFGVWSSSDVLFSSSLLGDAKLSFIEDSLLIDLLYSFFDVVKFGIVSRDVVNNQKVIVTIGLFRNNGVSHKANNRAILCFV